MGPVRATVELVEAETLSPEVRRIVLKPSVPISFHAGQYISIRHPGTKRFHAFSIASAPVSPRLELFVKAEGPFTQTMLDAPIGASYEMMAPMGRFLSPLAAEAVLVAGGIGITPFLSLLRSFQTDASERSVWLLYSCRDRASITAESELRSLGRVPGVRVSFTLTRERPRSWDGDFGRLDRRLLLQHLSSLERKSYYICGPDKMVADVRAVLKRAGVPSTLITSESWG